MMLINCQAEVHVMDNICHLRGYVIIVKEEELALVFCMLAQ